MSITDGYITTADGVRLFFQTLGSGPKTLIILNGFTLLDDFKYLAEDHSIVALDLRSRGRSDFVTDNSKLSRGVQHDVDDLETVRRYFELDQINLLGHSYAAVTVILYALKFPARVDRIVQIGPMAPDSSKRYPAHLTNTDSTLQEFFVKIQELEKERASTDPIQFCKKFWSALRPIYVTNPADADKLKWENCHLMTERNLMPHLM